VLPHGTSLWLGFAQRRPAPLIDAAEALGHLDPSTIPQRLGAVITTSTATIRVPADHPTIDHRKRLWDRRSEIAADRFQILYQKNYALCGNCLNLEFGLIQPLAD
jgi:hypothetical protein